MTYKELNEKRESAKKEYFKLQKLENEYERRYRKAKTIKAKLRNNELARATHKKAEEQFNIWLAAINEILNKQNTEIK